MKKKNIGTTLDGWLREEGLYEGVSATAMKRVVARHVEARAQIEGRDLELINKFGDELNEEVEDVLRYQRTVQLKRALDRP
jgi:hypothetical protein